MKNEPIKIHGKEYMTRDLRKQLLQDAIKHIELSGNCMCAAFNVALRTFFKNKYDIVLFSEQEVLKKFLFPDFHRRHFEYWYQSSGRTLNYGGRFFWIDIQDKQTRINFLKHLIFITDDDSLVIPYHDERVEQEKTSGAK